MAFKTAIALSALENNQLKQVEIGETKIVLVRQGDSVHAYQANCPHAGAPLEKGAICEGKLVCPWHKAVYDLEDGSLDQPPSLESLKKYAVKIEYGQVMVEVDNPTQHTHLQAGEESDQIVILGSGAAGSAALSALEESGYHGRIVVIDQEKSAPYDRTALTKFVPNGSMDVSEVPTLLEENAFEQKNVQRIVSTVTQIDSKKKKLLLANQQHISFKKLLIATGGAPTRPDLPGVELSGIHVLRNLQQEKTLLCAVDQLKQLVIVGNSFIGMEMAAALRKRGIDIKVIAPHPLPFEAQFGEEIARYFRALHEQNGVEFIDGEVAGFTGDRRVEAVNLQDGSQVKTDVVLLATGVKPVTSFVHDLPLNEDGSMKVDEYLQAAEDIYAVGDIASFPLDGKPTRIEHWRVAQQQGRTAAKNMLGEKEVYDRVPFFWTQQFGTRFEHLGHPQKWDNIDIIGSLEDQNFVALYGLKNHLVGVFATGRVRTTGKLLLEMQHDLTLKQAQQLVNETQEGGSKNG
ncbi:FAD-dependent oxidoreductase [Rouxiella sp. T17]|uniref:FAD-dependent oxidoreductase n=1 Tax=Rouxiella sp. T17 TaxID=3085684 RepID=UPI002FC76F10